MKLYGNRVLVKPTVVERSKYETDMESTIDTSKIQGGVIAFIGTKVNALEYQVGSSVLIDAYQYKPILFEKEEYLLTTDEFIIGKL